MDYLDFDLEIGPGSGEEYALKVLSSPAGEAAVTLHFPFDAATLETRLLKLQNALLCSGGEQRRRLLSSEEQAVQDFGERLFAALFAGEVGTRYAVSRSSALQAGKGLRLRLRVQPPNLAALPWEYLYDASQAEYVCLSQSTPLVRYLELSQAIQPLTVTPPLRILAMIASPSDQDALDIEHEQSLMRNALKDLEEEGLVKLRMLSGQTWQELQEAMWRGPWHIFHFIGHGGFDAKNQQGVLALADEQGKTHLLSATALGRLLADHGTLRLVVLNACEGAKGSEVDLFASTAATLARKGIPAVLAMQYEITDKAALQCSQTFYRALAAGMPVDGAVAAARQAISFRITNTLEWGTPVLYLRASDGILFHLPQQDASFEQLPPAKASSGPTPTQPLVEPSDRQEESVPPPLKQPEAPVLLTPKQPEAPSVPAALLLFAIAGGTPPLRIPLQKATITIGREADNDLVIPDSAVSRQHVRLTCTSGSWRVTRLPNTGPVYLNGRQRDEAELHAHDQLVIGGTMLRFEPGGASMSVTNLGSEQVPLLITPEPVPHLTVHWPGGRFVVPLREATLSLGRAPESGIVIPTSVVSTRHAMLRRAPGGGYLIEDTKSRNGLMFQTMRVQRYLLGDGDRLLIGSRADGQFVTLAYASLRSKQEKP